MEKKTAKPEMSFDRNTTARLLLGRLSDQKLYVVLWCIAIAAGIAIDAGFYWMVKYFTDEVIAQPDLAKVFPAARGIVFIVVLLVFGQGIQKGAELILTNRVGQWLIMDLRQSIYNHLQILGLDFFETKKTGQIMSWVTTDVLRIREFAGKQLPKLVRGPFAIITFLVMMFITSWQLMLAGLIVIPLVVIVVQAGSRKIRSAALAVQGTLADVSGELQEGISTIQVVRSFANEGFEIMKFLKANVGAYRAEMKRALIEAVMVPILMLAGGLGLGLLLLYGAYQVAEGMIAPGDLVMIIALLHKTNEEANKLGRTYMAFQDTLAAADRIFAFLHIKPTIVDTDDAVEFDKCEGEVEFRDVSFKYTTGDYVLRNINVKAEPGSAVAFVGPSGAGKSSLAKLVPRFYDVTEGAVFVDGIDVRKIKMDSLRNQLAIVPQETILFHGTVRDNIKYGKLDATDSEIEEAARSGNAHDFILQFEKGYDTIVGERGTKLSGGQRQRISISRAILKDPRILILDEATSNLDTESEKIVQIALERLMKGRTTFIIAHRLSTIRNASEIIVLRDGRIVDRGTHEELMARTGLYHELYEVEGVGNGNGV